MDRRRPESIESGRVRAALEEERIHRLAPDLEVLTGPTNVGVLRRGGRLLLLGAARPERLERAGIRPERVDWVLVTHAERAGTEGLSNLVSAGARVAVPEGERDLLEGVERFWASDSYRLHAYQYHPSPRALRESVPVARGLRPGDTLEWQGVSLRAVEAPGPTEAGLCYLVESEGTRVAFIGDLMCAPGQLWDFHGLQGRRRMPGGEWLMEYHGFGERALDCVASLKRVLERGPSRLVPLRGVVIETPRAAVEELERKVDACLQSYWSTSSGRWYFGGARPEWPKDVSALRKRCRPLPTWVREVGGTSRALVSEDGHVLLIDCDRGMETRIGVLRRSGQLGPVEALWITHYHDDHVGAANALRAQEGCRILAHESAEDILRQPQAYRMPCLEPGPIEVDWVSRDRETWHWRGFRLTAFTLPGQSLFDAALLAERGGTRVLFTGDSFTPGGLDDYCIHNRNLLGPGLGYDRCLDLLEELGPDVLLVNEHVEGAFVFSRQEVRELRRELARRRELFRGLFPWDDPNYGLDPQWVRVDPYYQTVEPGEEVVWEVCVRSHSAARRDVRVDLKLPRGWKPMEGGGSTQVPPGAERRVRLSAVAPADGKGRAVIGVSLRFGGLELPEAAEAVMDVGAGGGEAAGRRA